MMMLAFVAVNLFVFMAWQICISSLRQYSLAETLVFAGLLTAAQIISSQLALGIVGVLDIAMLLPLMLGISVIVLGATILMRRRELLAQFGTDAARLADAARLVRDPFNAALLLLLLFVTIWFSVAAWLLPPRGIDDLVAHLPPIYQYAQDGEISLLPLKLRDQFAMPLNGEFLFMWPLLFFHADTAIDFVQYVVALFGIVVVYVLARAWNLERSEALFAGLLFPFTPLVIAQSASNYIDLIVGVTYLLLVYSAVRFWQTGSLFHLLMAAVVTGLGLGIKHNLMIGVIAIQPLILMGLWRTRSAASLIRDYSLYALVATPFFIYWYARNYLATGYPLYPYDLSWSGLSSVEWSMSVNYPGRGIGSSVPNPKAIVDLLRAPVGFFLNYLVQDPGIGSFNGGFGLVFWGLGLPAIGWCLFRAGQAALRRDWLPGLFWAHVPLVWAIYLLQINTLRLQFNQRLILVLVGFGLLALALALRRFREDYPSVPPVIRSVCVVTSFLVVMSAAGYHWPATGISAPVADWRNENRTSDYKYFDEQTWDLPLLADAWEPLDYLTRGRDGWDVFTAAPWGISWTTPVYGSRLQNRVWNFRQPQVGFFQDEPRGFPRQPAEHPDAFIFHRMYQAPLFYLGREITPDMVWSSGRYELARHTPTTQFWVNRRHFDDDSVTRRLVEFYSLTYGEEIEAIRQITDRLPDSGSVVTDNEAGHALRFLSLTGELSLPVRLVPRGRALQTARALNVGTVITIGEPLAGFTARIIARARTRNGSLTFYENRRP